MIFSKPLIDIAQIIFTIWFVVRTVRKYSSVFFHHKSLLTKIGTAFVFVSVVISTNLSTSNLFFFTPTLSALVFPFVMNFIFSKKLEILCCKGFPKMIDNAILEIHRGSSLRLALTRALRHMPEASRPLIQSALDGNSKKYVETSNLLPKSVQKYVTELLKIERSPSNQLARLKYLRDHIYSQLDFRHKSGQALLQTRIQATLILVLYISVFIFSLFQHPWSRLKPFAFISIAMLVTGLCVLQIITRKRSWKI